MITASVLTWISLPNPRVLGIRIDGDTSAIGDPVFSSSNQTLWSRLSRFAWMRAAIWLQRSGVGIDGK